MSNSVTKIKPTEQDVATTVTPMDMLSIAVEKGADLDQLERLMALQERYEASQRIKSFNSAMAEFSKVAPTLEKSSKVDYKTSKGRTKYNHEDLADIGEILRPIISEFGFSYTWKTEQPSKNSVKVTCIVTHRDGHFTETPLESDIDSSGSKNNIQALGSACTYLERYTLKAAFGLAAKEQDNDGAGSAPEHISAEQKQELINLLGNATAPFLKHAGLKSLDDMHAGKFEKAKQMIIARNSNANS